MGINKGVLDRAVLLLVVSIAFAGLAYAAIAGSTITATFVDPTQADNANISVNFTIINITIADAADLNEMVFDWNGINYTFFNNNLLLLMNFDQVSSIGENSTYAVDISRYSFNGTLLNGASYNTDSKYGKSVYLDGTDDEVSIPHNASLDFGTLDFTVMLWIKRSGTGTDGIVENGYFDGAGFSMFFTSTNNMRVRAATDTIDTSATAGATVTSADGWTHIAVVGDRDGNIVFYKNGEFSHSQDISGASASNIASTQPFRIGTVRNIAGTHYYTQGYFDEVKIFNQTLSANTIKQHYYATLYKFNSSNYIFYSTQQNLSNGTYTYAGYVSDSSTSSSTGTRTLNVGGVGGESSPANDTTAPAVLLSSPTNAQSFTSTNNITFTVAATDGVDLDNCTLWTNITGSWLANNTKTFTGTSDSDTWDFYNLSNAGYLWNAYCCDNSSNCAWNGTNYTFNVNYNPSATYEASFLTNGTTTTAYNYSDGTLVNLQLNSSANYLYLASGSNGNFTSQVFSAGLNTSWNNISWLSNAGNLPANKQSDPTLDLTGNVLLMHFDETSGNILDYSGEGNTGTVSGATHGAAGKIGSALDIDGSNDYVSIASSSDFAFGTGNLTVAVWAKADTTNSNYHWIFDKYTNGRLVLGISDTNKWRINAGTNTDGSTVVTGQWTHLAAVRIGSTMYLYENGRLVNSGSGHANNILADIVVIGQRGDMNDVAPFDGKVDELALFNRALSASEIESIYKRGLVKLNFTARSCDDASCSGESWTDIIDSSPQTMSISNNTYFQYQTEFTTDNTSFSPQLYNVTVFYGGNVSGASGEGGNSTAGSITITYPVQYVLFQRDAYNFSNITIEGTYTGNVSSVEARFNGGSWQTIAAGISGGSFAGNLTNQTVGQGLLEVRSITNNSVNDSVAQIGIGDIYAIAGQSNAEMRGTNAQHLNTSNIYNATVYREDDAWRVADDPVDTGTSIGSSWPHLADHIIQGSGIPMAFVSAAAGGSAVTEWQKGGAYYNNLIAQINEATHGTNHIKALLYFQGERDSSTSGTGCNGNYTCYYTNLGQLASDFMSDVNAAGVVVGQTHFQPTGNRTTNDNIRKAQQDLWNDDPNILFGAVTYDIGPLSDNLHFKTDAELQTKANRWWAALDHHFYADAYGRGPTIINASFDAGTRIVTLVFNTSRNLTSGSGTQGWRIVDGTTVLNDSNIITASVTASDTLALTLDTTIGEGSTISLGSYNDGDGKNILTHDCDLFHPAEMIFSQLINISTLLIDYANPTPSNGSSVNDSYVGINISVTNANNIGEMKFNWNGTNYTFYDNNLVLAMGFNNDSTLGESVLKAVDISKYGNNGTILGSPAWNSTGKYNGAYDFDGSNDFLNVTSRSSLNFGTADFTIEAWIKTQGSGIRGIAAKTDYTGTYDSSNGYVLYLDSTDKLVLKAQSWTINSQSTGTVTAADGWTHVVAVADRDGNVTFYKNGQNIGSSDISAQAATSITSTYDLRIGTIRYGQSEFFNGSIDELKIYNRTLSAAEVMQHYYANFYKYDTNKWIFYTNESVANGNYTFAAYAQDTGSNIYSTDLRHISVSIATPDTTAPAAVSGLNNQSAGTTWIYWNWTNPSDADFSAAIVYLNGTNLANTSNNYYNATGLNTDSSYVLRINTKDTSGNVNYTNVTSTAMTLAGPDTAAPTIQSTTPSNTSSLSAGTTSYTIRVITDEIATCRYNTSNAAWDNMTQLNGTNSTSHNFTVSGLSDSTTYNYYFLCEDDEAVPNRMSSSYHLQFSVSAAGGGNGGGSGGGGGGSSSSASTAKNETCEEKWTCTWWSNCINDKKTRSCTEQNGCGTSLLKPSEVKECDVVCEEKWACTEWGPCEGGAQIRFCREVNNCGTTANKPAEEQGCLISQANVQNEQQPPSGAEITGRAVVSPINLPNPQFLIPTILFGVVLVALILMRHSDISKKARKIVVVLYIIVLGFVFTFIFLTFKPSTLTGLSFFQGADKLFIFKFLLLAFGAAALIYWRRLAKKTAKDKFKRKNIKRKRGKNG